MKFEMQIMNVFRLSNGRIVLGGLIPNHPELIGKCNCELLFNGEFRQNVDCEGEQIVKKHSPNDLRALATTQEVTLTSIEAQSGRWKLICN